MMRYIIVFLFFLVVYYAVKAVVRSAISTATKDAPRTRIPGDEMVLDPECHTYVVKDRAVSRHINGKLCFFCSEACARKYQEKDRT